MTPQVHCKMYSEIIILLQFIRCTTCTNAILNEWYNSLYDLFYYMCLIISIMSQVLLEILKVSVLTNSRLCLWTSTLETLFMWRLEIPDKSGATVPKWRKIWLSEDSTTLSMFLHLWCGKLFLMLVEILFLWCVSLNEFYAFILSYNIRYFL